MLKKVLLPAFLATFVFLGTAHAYAQAAQSTAGANNDAAKAAMEQDVQAMRQDIRDHRKQIVAANMVLTADESTKFWPVYDEYIQETIKINDTRWELIKSYATNYDTMSDSMASDFIKKSSAVEQQLNSLRDKYAVKFEKAIPAKKAALWYQIDRRLDLAVDLQLASIIPVVDATK
jgi:Spy/CpxP family protein refolding chaperone